MGRFSLSYHLRTEDFHTVENALKQYLLKHGSELRDVLQDYPDKPCREPNHGAALVSDPTQGWTSIVTPFMWEGEQFLESLTDSLDAPALAVYLSDSDSWGYHLYQIGKCLHQYYTFDAHDSLPYELYNTTNHEEELAEIINAAKSNSTEYNWLQHCEVLLPLQTNPSLESTLRVLIDLKSFGEEGLTNFYQLLGIPTLYTYISYTDLVEKTSEELQKGSINFKRHWIVS